MGDFSPFPGSRVGGTLQLFATGNTTGGTSSAFPQGPTLTFSGAGLISVGMSNNSIIVSGASTGGISIIGTTGGGTTSSQPLTIGAGSTLSGGGAASVGFSGGTIIVSVPTTVSLSHFEPDLFGAQGSFACSVLLGDFAVQPIQIPGVLSINQIGYYASIGTQFTGLQQSSTVSTTASASVVQTLTWALYSQLSGTASSTWTIFASTTFSVGVKDSISCSSSSQTKSQTLFYNIGGTTSSTSATTSSISGTVNVSFMGTGFTQGMHRIDCPWATSFPPGSYLLAVGGNSGSTVAGTGTMSLNVLRSYYGVTVSSATSNYFAPVGVDWTTGTSTGSGTLMFGVGFTNAAGTTAPATINPSALAAASTQMSQPRMYVILRNGGS